MEAAVNAFGARRRSVWRPLRRALSRHPLASLSLVAAFAAFVLFGGLLIDDSTRFDGRAGHERTVAPWMSPRYVGRAWDLPAHEVLRLMEIDDAGPGAAPRTVGDALALTGLTLGELRARLEASREGAPHGGNRSEGERLGDDVEGRGR